MNMRDHFRVILMTFALATVALIAVACSNPRPVIDAVDSPEMKDHFCDRYKMQIIQSGDSNEERIRKLRENTYFQRICS